MQKNTTPSPPEITLPFLLIYSTLRTFFGYILINVLYNFFSRENANYITKMIKIFKKNINTFQTSNAAINLGVCVTNLRILVNKNQ